jgi:sugar phosphate permease
VNIKGTLSWSISALFVLYLFLLQASTSVMVPQLSNAFHIDAEGVGILSASFFYSYIFLQMPAGSVVDRFGARKILIFSLAGCVLACYLFATTHHIHVAQFSRILMGVMTSSGIVCALFLATNWFSPARFTLLVGLTEMLGMLGGAVGQDVLSYSVSHWGWRETLLICALAGLVIGILALLFVRDFPNNKTRKSPQNSLFNEMWQVVRLPKIWINGLYGGLVFAIITGFAGLWSVPYLMKLYHADLSLASEASSMVFWGAAIGNPVMGWLSEKLKMRWHLMFAGTSLAAATLFFIFYVNSIPLPLMFFLLFSLGFFCAVYGLIFAVARDMIPSSCSGAAMGFTNMMCILIGAPIFQPLIGWILKRQEGDTLQMGIRYLTPHNYEVAFIILPLGLLLALISLIFIRGKS